jgi:Tol biopolymer transport system component
MQAGTKLMNPERWRQIEELYHAALERAPDERADFLAEHCGADQALRHEVELLLAEHARGGGLLEQGASDLAADWVNEEAQPTREQTLGHFRILSLLGKGGMGEVHLAEDLRLHRKVALKLLPAEFIEHETRLRRFEQEARAASALNHPNIITIYDIGEVGQTHFIATEYVEGQTLRALLKQGALPLKIVLDVAIQVASALATAHAAGILHRDIKPENLMRRPDGLVKVLDFGLAKLSRPQLDAATAATADAALSTPGMVMGTLAYMSPEQAQGLDVDARTDVFSLGAVLYEMATGQRAFRGDSQMAVLRAVIEEEPASLPASVPADCVNLILRCLRKEPARRFQSAADLQAALEDLRAESAASRQRPARAPRRWMRVAMPVLIALSLIVAFFAWQRWRTPPIAEPLQAVALTTLPGTEQFPSLSPDGNYLAFTWNGAAQDNPDVYVQQIGAGAPVRRTTDAQADYNPVWSPDGRWLAFFRSQPLAPTGLRQRELWLMPPLNGPARKLADIQSQDFFPVATYLAWSADSQSLIVTDATGARQPDALFVIALATGEKKQLTHPAAPVLADTSPAMAPDGRALVFLRRTTWAAGELHWLLLETNLTAAGETRRLTPTALRADFPAWLPDGNEIVFAAKGNLWRMAVAGAQTPKRLAYIGEDGLMPVIARAQEGKAARLVYVRNSVDTNLWRVETAAASAPALMTALSSTKHEYHCVFSPDGRRVAFTSTRSGDAEIWVADADGANAVQLTSLHAQDSNCAAWSPDGQSIAFSSNGEGEFDVYVIPAAGGQPRRLTSHPAIDIAPKFSRDGQWLYFSSMRTGEYRVWKMPAAGGEATQVSPNQGSGGAVESFDGRSLYYHTPAVVSPLWRLPLAGGAPVKVLDGIVWFNWCLFGDGAYLIDRQGGETRLQFFNFVTGKSVTVARNLGEVTGGLLTVSPDGRTIIFARVDAYADDLMLVENFR